MLLIIILQRLVGTDDSIRALVWIPNGETERLLSAGLGGSVVEWDLTTLKEKRKCDSYAGPIWSLSLSRSGEFLAVGCESGKVTWLDVSDGALQYKKSFQPAGKGTFALVFLIYNLFRALKCKIIGKILCLSWGKGDKELVTGGSDGCIRIFDTLTGRSTSKMAVSKSKRKRAVLWAVSVLR